MSTPRGTGGGRCSDITNALQASSPRSPVSCRSSDRYSPLRTGSWAVTTRSASWESTCQIGSRGGSDRHGARTESPPPPSWMGRPLSVVSAVLGSIGVWLLSAGGHPGNDGPQIVKVVHRSRRPHPPGAGSSARSSSLECDLGDQENPRAGSSSRNRIGCCSMPRAARQRGASCAQRSRSWGRLGIDLESSQGHERDRGPDLPLHLVAGTGFEPATSGLHQGLRNNLENRGSPRVYTGRPHGHLWSVTE